MSCCSLCLYLADRQKKWVFLSTSKITMETPKRPWRSSLMTWRSLGVRLRAMSNLRLLHSALVRTFATSLTSYLTSSSTVENTSLISLSFLMSSKSQISSMTTTSKTIQTWKVSKRSMESRFKRKRTTEISSVDLNLCLQTAAQATQTYNVRSLVAGLKRLKLVSLIPIAKKNKSSFLRKQRKTRYSKLNLIHLNGE